MYNQSKLLIPALTPERPKKTQWPLKPLKPLTVPAWLEWTFFWTDERVVGRINTMPGLHRLVCLQRCGGHGIPYQRLLEEFG